MMSTQSSSMVASAILLAMLHNSVEACSTVMSSVYVDQNNCVSARTMDFFARPFDLNTSLALVPEGSTLWTQLLPQDIGAGTGSLGSALEDAIMKGGDALNFPSNPDLYYTSKYPFAAANNRLWEQLKAAIEHQKNITITDRMINQEFGEALMGSVTDGLNAQGLSCAMQYDLQVWQRLNATDYPISDVSDTSRPTIIAMYQLCRYILANFADADEVVTTLDPSTTQIVSPRYAQELNITFPLHVVVGDRHHQLWVLEFTKYDNGNYYKWKNATEYGVVTNAPSYEEQLDMLNAYIANADPVTQAIVNASIEFRSTGELNMPELVKVNDNAPKIQITTPATFKAQDRFQRLALYNLVAPVIPLPLGSTYLPPTNEFNQALSQVLLAINTVTLPRNAVFNGQAVPEQTLWRLLRDHSNGVLYFSALADTTWGRVNISSAVVDKAPLNEAGNVETFSGMEKYAFELNMAALGYNAIDMSNQF